MAFAHVGIEHWNAHWPHTTTTGSTGYPSDPVSWGKCQLLLRSTCTQRHHPSLAHAGTLPKHELSGDVLSPVLFCLSPILLHFSGFTAYLTTTYHNCSFRQWLLDFLHFSPMKWPMAFRIVPSHSGHSLKLQQHGFHPLTPSLRAMRPTNAGTSRNAGRKSRKP